MARLGRGQPRGVFVPVGRPPSTGGGNHSSVTATDTIATLTDTATRISHVSLKATDTVATETDTATRLLALPRTASDTVAALTDTATRAAQHFTRSAADTEAALTESATRLSSVSLKATDTIATETDTVSKSTGVSRTAADTVASITDAATRGAQHFPRTASDAIFAETDVATGPPVIVYTYVPAPEGWQPWNVPGFYAVVQWDSEVYQGGGLGEPPPINTPILCAQVDMGAFTLKVWIPSSEVTPSG